MAERRTLGQILLGYGRIDEADVERALKHQETAGGYFGEALRALGIVSQEELEWGLASQFDLPYVFPDADSIDPEAADLVTPEWALAHLTLPIMKTADTVTVIVDSPLKTDPVDELQHRTGLKIELALASAAKIRELIRQIYSRPAASGEVPEGHAPVRLSDLFGEALEHGAKRMGISVRGRRVTGWYEDRGTIRRRHVTTGWSDELEKLVTPSPAARLDSANSSWTAQLEREGVGHPVEVSVLSSPAGTEYLFKPVALDSGVQQRFPPPSQGVLAEVRLLARSGTARFGVSTEPPELASEILPFLPMLLLEPSWRSAHLAEGERDHDEVFSVALPSDPEERQKRLEELRIFHFDAVTADLSGPLESWADGVLDLAAAAFVPWERGDDRKRAERAGVRWELRIDREPGGRLEWSLLPLK